MTLLAGRLLRLECRPVCAVFVAATAAGVPGPVGLMADLRVREGRRRVRMTSECRIGLC
jgi:hypothetical protein